MYYAIKAKGYLCVTFGLNYAKLNTLIEIYDDNISNTTSQYKKVIDNELSEFLLEVQ